MKKYYLTFLLLTIGFAVFAQNKTVKRCATFDGIHQHRLQNPDYAKKMAKMQSEWKSLKVEKKAAVDIIIPVVFHVLHNQQSGAITGNNISDEQILSQIDRLNVDYASLNTDIGDVPSVFQDVIPTEGTGIQFCLAQIDPQGQPTTGITRTYTDVTAFDAPFNPGDDEPMKFAAQGGVDAWSPCGYLNIWVVPALDDGITLGYAQFPESVLGFSSLGPETDGVVLAHNFVGDEIGTTTLPYNMGRTASHEVGHYLGLFHTFEGGCSALGDEVDDTPSQSVPNLGCPSAIPESCGSNDMYVNYMDYSDDACLLMFTQEQADRMLMFLNTDDSRSCLLNAATGNCSLELSADFSAADTILCEGESVQFSDRSSGPRSGWQWTFEGGEPASSFEQNPVVTYNTAGTYSVTLIITTDDAEFETVTKEGYITVFTEADCPEETGEPCTAFMPGGSPLGGPFIELNPVPCGDDCGTAVTTGFEVYSNEGYTLNNLTAGSSYNVNICNGAGAGSWEPILTLATFDDDIVGSVVTFADGCSLDFTVPQDGNYILVITQKGVCDGAATNQIDNGFIELTCTDTNACAPETGPCIDFVAGSGANAGGPFNSLNPIPAGDDCGNVAITSFEVYSNEAYTLEALTAGSVYDISICEGTNAGSWNPVLTVAEYDLDNETVGDVVTFAIGCAIKFSVPNDGDYIVVITEEDNCDGGAPNQIENGLLTVACGDASCTLFTLGGSPEGGGPFNNLNEPPIGSDCSTPAVTAFEVYSNEAYTLENLTAGDAYNLNICSGASAGSWNPILTIATYDSENVEVGEVVTFAEGCTIDFTVPEDGSYILIITEQGICDGNAPNGIDNGNLSLSCLNIEQPAEACTEFEAAQLSTELSEAPTGANCPATITTANEVFSNQAYTFDNLVGGESYGVNICNGDNAGSWDAVLTLAAYTVDAVGEVVTFTDSCALNFTVPEDGNYILIISEKGACDGAASNELANGLLEFSCIEGIQPTADPCTEFVAGEFPLGGPFNNISVEVDGVLRAPCGEKCDTSVGFGVYINEAYYIRRAIEGAEYLISICEGENAGSWDANLTIAYYDTLTATVGEAVIAVEDCSLNFTVPETGNYLLIITEAGNCTGEEPIQTENGILSMSCVGENPCKEGQACTEFVIGNFPLGGPFTDINENSTLCGLDCGDTLTLNDFTVYANEAYTLNNLLAGNSYNLNICSGIGAGSWNPNLTIAYYDPTNEIVGDAIDFIWDCSINFTVPEDSSYILVITEQGICEAGLTPLQVDNGHLQVYCLGNNSCIPPCDNNTCAAALAIDGGIGTIEGPFDNSCATSEGDPAIEDGCFALEDTFTNTLWFSFVGDGQARRITTDNTCEGISNPLIDAQIAVFREGCEGELVACDEDGGLGLNALVDIDTEDGVTYYIVVDSWGGITGEFCLNITEPFTCSVGTTNISLPNNATGSGTSDDPYQICGNQPLTFSSEGDFSVNELLTPNPAIAWAYYTDQPTSTDPFNDPNAILQVVLNPDNGNPVFNNGEGSFLLSPIPPGTYVLVPVIIANAPSLNIESGCTGVDLSVTYPYITFIDSDECAPEPCITDAGTMPSEGINICGTDNTNVISNGDQVLDDGDVATYILHTSSDANLGIVLAENPDGGIFNVDSSPDIQVNTTYYISLYITSTNNPDCDVVSTGTPVIFLDACDPNCSNTSAGTMPNEEQNICGNNSTNISSNGDAVVNPGDVTTYVLHTRADNTLGTVLAENANAGVFSLANSPNIQTGTTYYISYVVYPNGNETCPAVAAGTPIIFLDACHPICSNASAGTMPSEQQNICGNGSTNVNNNGDAVINSSDVTTYVLHTRADNTLGTVLAVNANVGVFSLASSTNTQTGTTYYISFVIYPNGNTACPAVSAGTPVVFLDECHPICSTASAGTMPSEALNICSDASTNVLSNGDASINTGDVTTYILHTNSGNSLGTILAENANAGVFSLASSSNIQIGTTYYISFVIYPNGNTACPTVAAGTPVTFVDGCACVTSSAGTMPSETVSICGAGSSNVTVNSDAIVSPADVTTYILHTNSGNSLGTILAENAATGAFNLASSSNIQTGVTYYISFVIYPNGNQECPQIAAGTPVIFGDACDPNCITSSAGVMPMVEVEVAVCGGETSPMDLSTSGAIINPGDVTKYVLHTSFNSDDLGTILAEGAVPTFSLESSPNIQAYTTYYISFVLYPNGEESCPLIALGPPVVFFEPISFVIDETCEEGTSNYIVTASVTGGSPPYDGSTYSVSGDFTGNLAFGANFTVTYATGTVNTYNFTVANDNYACSGTTIMSDPFECSKTPIELITFDGEPITEGNLLKWVTLTEVDNAYFAIERSENGLDFEVIGTIEGAGTTTSVTDYEFLDKTPFRNSYYRLRQVDVNETESVSNIILLVREESNLNIINIQPNPVIAEVQITFSTSDKQTLSLEVYDITGKKLWQESLDMNRSIIQKELNISDFPAGVYFLRINDGNNVVTRKLVKK